MKPKHMEWCRGNSGRSTSSRVLLLRAWRLLRYHLYRQLHMLLILLRLVLRRLVLHLLLGRQLLCLLLGRLRSLLLGLQGLGQTLRREAELLEER